MKHTSHAPCPQEPRLASMEVIQAGLLENLKELKALFVASIKAEERIAALQQDRLDQEKRLRRLEIAGASGKWVERVIWLVVSAGIGLLLKFGGQS